MNDPMNDHRPEQLFAAVAMLTDLQGVCHAIRPAVEELAAACRQIEALDPCSISLETLGAVVQEFQAACDKTGPCLQKLEEASKRYGG